MDQKKRQRVGSIGENIAAAYLKSAGYQILERNLRLSIGELDMVASEHGTLVFVEVRTRRGDKMGPLEEAIPDKKKTKLRLLAELYLQQKPNPERHVRIDVVLVDLAPDGSARRIELIKNAVES